MKIKSKKKLNLLFMEVVVTLGLGLRVLICLLKGSKISFGHTLFLHSFTSPHLFFYTLSTFVSSFVKDFFNFFLVVFFFFLFVL
jgi:hypothetical protein